MINLEQRIRAVNVLTNRSEVRELHNMLQLFDTRNPLVALAREKGII